MLGRDQHTLLLVHRDFLARADFAGPGAARRLQLRRMPRPDEDGLVELVAVAAAGAPLQRQVWVLTDELLAETIELDARAVRGLGHAELTTALAYEAQELTGIPTAEGATAWRAGVGGTGRAFLVTQMPRADLEQVSEIVRDRGGRLAGIGHPAGLPRSLVGSNGAAFRRTEIWSGLQADVAGEGGQPAEVRIRRTGTRRGAREVAGGVPTEWLMAAAGAAPAATDGARLLRLDDEDVLGRWLDGWAAVLAAREGEVPLLAPPQKPLSGSRRVVWSVLLAAAVVALAVFDWTSLHRRKLELDAQTKRVQDQIATFEAGKKELASVKQQLDALRREAESADTRAPRWSADVTPDVLAALAGNRPAGLLVEELDIGWEKSSIRGHALGPELVNDLARTLADELQGTAFHVNGAAKRLGGEGLYEFEITLAPPVAVVPVPARSSR